MAKKIIDKGSLKKGITASTVIGGTAAFTAGAYLCSLEHKGLISKKQKWIAGGLYLIAVYCSGIGERLLERKECLDAIDKALEEI